MAKLRPAKNLIGYGLILSERSESKDLYRRTARSFASTQDGKKGSISPRSNYSRRVPAAVLRGTGNRGFTLMDVMMASVIIILVAFLGSRLLLQSTRALSSVGKSQQASTLADMVFEQYKSYALTNFQTLSSHDVSRQTPAQFFNRSDNMGYDNFLITSSSTYAADQSTCSLTVTLNWAEGGQQKQQVFTKLYSEASMILPGADVTVTVQTPTNPPYAVPNIIVSAPGVVPGNTSSCQTDPASGQCTLHNVVVGGSVTVTIASPPPSDVTISSSMAGFTQGYYAAGPNGTYLASFTMAAVVQLNAVNSIVVSSFLPAGYITGHVTNSDGGSVANSTCTLDEHSIAWSGGPNGAYQHCPGGCNYLVTSDTSGAYGFFNVVPGNLFLRGLGQKGSDPKVQQTASNFKFSYASPGPYSVTLSSSGSNQPIGVLQDVNLQKLGWITLNTVDKITGNAIGGVTVSLNLPGNTPYFYNEYISMQTDSNGLLQLNNVIGTPSVSVAFSSVYRNPQNGDYGYLLDPSFNVWTCAGVCASGPNYGADNPITLPMDAGYMATGNIIDDNTAGGPGVQNLSVSLAGPYFLPGGGSFTMLPNGNFTLLGVFPTPYPPNAGVQPNVFFAAAVSPRNGFIYGIPVANVPVSATDKVIGSPAPAVTILTPTSVPGVYKNITTDVNGNATLSATLQYQQIILKVPFYCDSSQKCVPCDSSGNCSASVSIHVNTACQDPTSSRSCALMEIDPSTGSWRFQYAYFGFYRYYIDNSGGFNSFFSPATSVYSAYYTAPPNPAPFVPGIQQPVLLAYYPVTGFAQEGGTPVPNIQVCDAAKAGNCTTSSNGSNGIPVGWYQLYPVIQGRTATNYGKVGVYGGGGTTANGIYYPATPQTGYSLPVPDPSTANYPNAPLTQDISVSRQTGGGGT